MKTTSDDTLNRLRTFVEQHRARFWVQTCSAMTDLFARHGAIALPNEFVGYFIGHDNQRPLPDDTRYYNLTEDYAVNRDHPYTLFLLPDNKVFDEAYKEARNKGFHAKPKLTLNVIPATVISLDYWLSAVADEYGQCYYTLVSYWGVGIMVKYGAIEVPAAYAPLLTDNTTPPCEWIKGDYDFNKNFGYDEENEEDDVRRMVIVAYRSPETFAQACDEITENLRYVDSQLSRFKDDAERLFYQLASYIGLEMEDGIYMIPERDIERLRSLVAKAEQLLATATQETPQIKSLRSNLEMAKYDLYYKFFPLEMLSYSIKDVGPA